MASSREWKSAILRSKSYKKVLATDWQKIVLRQ
jgi:hypothetical protein